MVQITLKAWTKQEDDKLREIYPSSTTEDLTKIFNRSIEAIRGRAFRLKIRRNGFILQETLRDRARARWAAAK
jgi:hypothetical protein